MAEALRQAVKTVQPGQVLHVYAIEQSEPLLPYSVSAKRALITGITGQDGSYLSEYLLAKNYEVHGIVRRVALEDPANRLSRIHHIRPRLKLHAASLESYASIHRVVHEVQPDECYHLAAQSFVSYSFDDEFLHPERQHQRPPRPQDLT
jgi:nucleoside-diphosphate-sugar epimerase